MSNIDICIICSVNNILDNIGWAKEHDNIILIEPKTFSYLEFSEEVSKIKSSYKYVMHIDLTNTNQDVPGVFIAKVKEYKDFLFIARKDHCVLLNSYCDFICPLEYLQKFNNFEYDVNYSVDSYKNINQYLYLISQQSDTFSVFNNGKFEQNKLLVKNLLRSPKITVITCLYNTKPSLFRPAILGLVNQLYKDFEVLVVNDGSDKYIEENISFIQTIADSRIKFVNKEHAGKSQALNLALKLAQGKYIAINDSDDVSLPKRLYTQSLFLDENEKYDVISNAMLRENDNCIFPVNSKEGYEVNNTNIYYSVNHPCYMFRKSVIDKVPFLFCQLYDSSEDCVMNHIMYYYGVKFWYDPTVLLKYAYHENQVHWNNIKGFLKDVTYKISFNTFNYQNIDPKTACLIFLDEKWDLVEIEKTLLNIRLTSNNVAIYLCDYFNKFKLDDMYKYNVTVINNEDNSYVKDYLFGVSEKITEQNIMFIATPVRFYNHDWDLHIERELNRNKYSIFEPLLYDIEKIDSNNYRNEGNKKKHVNEIYGERLTLLTDCLSEKINSYEITNCSEYIFTTNMPLLSDKNVFMMNKEIFQGVMCNDILNYFSINNLFNVVFSLIAKCCIGYNIYKKLDIVCSYVNDNYDKTKNVKYYKEYFIFTKLFLNETQFVHQKIVNDVLERRFGEKRLDSHILDGVEALETKAMSLNDFQKNMNVKQSWIL